MANTNAPFGLRPYSYMSGGPYNGAVRTYYVPVGNGTALYMGDPVMLVTNSSDGNGVQTVGIASAGGGAQVLGAFQGISNSAGQAVITLQQSQPVYLPAATAAYVYVSDDPFLLYLIQENGGMVSGASGRNADLVAGTGSTVTAQSGWQLNSATLQTTATLQLRMIQLLQQGDNAVGTNAKWLVKINDTIHPFTTGTGT
jgi:hypothetical protein